MPSPPIPTTSSTFDHISPGKPTTSLQALTTIVFRQQRYVAYISGAHLHILSTPSNLVQTVSLQDAAVAVAAETATAKLAVACTSGVVILEPVIEGWTRVRWTSALALRLSDPAEQARWLSWGSEGECLVGGTRTLSLFPTLPSSPVGSPTASRDDRSDNESRAALWFKALASPVRWAAFSPLAGIIATCGDCDRLVKIWRRLSFEEARFDHAYLPHPCAVTHLQWRPRDVNADPSRASSFARRHDEDAEVLFTVAADGLLRVWKTGGFHDRAILTLHAHVDLAATIPDSPSLTTTTFSLSASSPPPSRYTFILSSEQFSAAVTAAIDRRAPLPLTHALEHLQEVVSKDPDVLVTLDGRGRMSAWGLYTVDHKRRPDTPSGLSQQPFHIAHAEALPLRFPDAGNARFGYWFDGDRFHLLAHDFGGAVTWWRAGVEALFSPAASGSEHLAELACWTGHATSVRGFSAGAMGSQGSRLVLWDEEGGLTSWDWNSNRRLVRATDSVHSGAIIDAVPVGATGVVTLRDSERPLVYCNGKGTVLWTGGDRLDTDARSKLRVFCSVPCGTNVKQRLVVLHPTASSVTLTLPAETQEPVVDTFHLADAAHKDDTVFMQAVFDPSDPDAFDVVALTGLGRVSLHRINCAADGSEPVLTASVACVESGVVNASLFAATRNLAVVCSTDGTDLVVLDLHHGYIECERSSRAVVRHVVLSDARPLLAVGYDAHVEVLVQGRYAASGDWPGWIPVQTVSVAGIGVAIHGLAWLDDGALAVAAGNGVLVSACEVPTRELHREVREAMEVIGEEAKTVVSVADVSRFLKTPHPVWHPELLVFLVQDGRWSLAVELVHRLLEKMRFWSEGDGLDPLLDVSLDQISGAQSEGNRRTIDAEVVAELIEQLDVKRLPHLSRAEQAWLQRVLEAMRFGAEHHAVLDHLAFRFLFAWKLECLRLEHHSSQANGVPNGAHSISTPSISWREIAFAFHSTTQQALLDILMAQHDGKITWPTARDLGLFAWVADRTALERIFESIAQSAYRASEPPDPTDATLYFLALRKKSTLVGLWRIATWHREQRATMAFLRRDFGLLEHRVAAKKNAYALMGKRRFHYAAAFFLLAHDPASATSVLAGQCADVMLAVAVARLHNLDAHNAILHALVDARVRPVADRACDRCMHSWCHAILGRDADAADVLVRPLPSARRWDRDDPLVMGLYRRLRRSRDRDGTALEAVRRSAWLLRRMGLWVPALQLVAGWDFGRSGGAQETTPRTPRAETTPAAAPSERASMLDGFSPAPVRCPPAAPSISPESSREAHAAEMLAKMRATKAATAAQPVLAPGKPPTQFDEPSADSLLDQFGV